MFASSEELSYFDKYEITGGQARFVGAAIISFYILITATIGAVIYSAISAMQK